MKRHSMKRIVGLLVITLVMAVPARAQVSEDLRIIVSGVEVPENGGEQTSGATLSSGRIILGKQVSGFFSMLDCGRFGFATSRALAPGALGGWTVDITPTRVEGNAVTFRLRWTRSPGTFFRALKTPASEDVEVTLKPGETRPLDSVLIGPKVTKLAAAEPCRTKLASLRVSAVFPNFDRRLVAADVWLVERLPNGKETSQLQSIRGVPHRSMPFYFDSLVEGSARVDISGQLTANLDAGVIELNLEAVRATPDPGQSGYQSARWFRSVVKVKPDEIIEVALEPIGDKSSPFANRSFSIRIRARQVR